MAAKSDDAKKAKLTDKVTAARARPRKRAAESATAPKAATAKPRAAKPASDNNLFRIVEDHPFAVLAGGLALGVIAAAIIPSSVSRKMGKQALALAALAGELGTSVGSKAMDAASDVSRSGREVFEEIASTVIEQGSEARRRSGDLAHTAATSVRESGESFIRKMIELAERARK